MNPFKWWRDRKARARARKSLAHIWFENFIMNAGVAQMEGLLEGLKGEELERAKRLLGDNK